MKSHLFKDKVFDTVNIMMLIFALIIVLYPIIFVVSASISDPVMINNGEVWLLPKKITFEGYRRVFQDARIWTGYRNTVIYTVLGTLVSLALTLSAAYPISRRDFYGRSIFITLFMFTMFFSGGLIPTYMVIKKLKMLNTLWVMIIPSAVGVWNIIIVRTYYNSTVPMELQEAALIDGCSNIRLFIRVILPLSKPIIAVMALFYGVGQWNSYFSALIYLSKAERFPLQLILRDILIVNEFSVEMLKTAEQAEDLAKKAEVAGVIKYALIIVSTLPIILIYPFLQKYFVKGIMVGALKG